MDLFNALKNDEDIYDEYLTDKDLLCEPCSVASYKYNAHLPVWHVCSYATFDKFVLDILPKLKK